MYDNIGTDHAIESIGKWFNLYKTDCRKSGILVTDFILKGIAIVMRNNIFDFNDITCWQENGTAMGTSLACMFATIYYSYHDRRLSVRALTNNHFTNCMTLQYESMWTIQVQVYLRAYESLYSMVYRYQYLATSVL